MLSVPAKKRPRQIQTSGSSYCRVRVRPDARQGTFPTIAKFHPRCNDLTNETHDTKDPLKATTHAHTLSSGGAEDDKERRTQEHRPRRNHGASVGGKDGMYLEVPESKASKRE